MMSAVLETVIQKVHLAAGSKASLSDNRKGAGVTVVVKQTRTISILETSSMAGSQLCVIAFVKDTNYKVLSMELVRIS